MFTDYAETGPALLGDKSHTLRGTFRLRNSNITVANTIRRSIVAHTASVAFRTEPPEKSDVVISVNTTPLVNEMIAHRLGMIPIRADIATFEPSHYEFVIDKENNTKVMMDVCASDIQVFVKNPDTPLEAPTLVPTEQFFPPDPITGDTCLITRLRPQWNPSNPNERIVLKAKASISTGSENIRWCPVSQCSYEYTRDTNEANIEAVFNNWLKQTKKIEDPAIMPSERLAELKREFNTMEIQRCYLKDEKGEPNDFTFFIESVGILSVPQIVKAGISACIAKVGTYVDVDAVLPEGVTVLPGDARFPCCDVYFQNESHTLGNLLETYLIANHVDGTAEPRITYAGYKVPHPLRPEMFVRIGMNAEDPEVRVQTTRLVIASVCRFLRDEFRKLQQSWDALAI
jgi:DNA-directed RNA polymerase subunit L/DNA-directed RNA polymerase alpha subunit